MVVMTTRGRAVALVVALALAASLLTLAVVLAKPAQAQAETITDTDRSTFSSLFGVTPNNPSCTEPVFIEGTLHTVAHTTIDANGGFHTKFHFNAQGQGEGLGSGDKYVFRSVSNSQQNSPTGADLEFTQTGSGKITRLGSDTTTDDWQVNFLRHVTVNAQGEVTAVVEKFERVCT